MKPLPNSPRDGDDERYRPFNIKALMIRDHQGWYNIYFLSMTAK
ncbi:hypothetical protein SAMN05216378_1845 [Paenibacillus catalpae]|uniref:Uncharacterized protein n=1 Tax=Paenibacillus catalpae TaxID=1045775 RepID=A0A1I1WRQ3_9BACL|nr:hypothetical protein SAMN05216378_1845 [Paenibacillus catalpae]